MQNFQDTFETQMQLFISAFSICMTVPLISIWTSFHLLLLLELIYCSCFFCFTAPIAMPNNDNTLNYINHTKVKYQNKNVKIVKI